MMIGQGTLVGGFAWASAGRLIAMATGFALTLILARGLTPAENGLYFVAFSAVVILSTLGAIGLDQMVVKFAAVRLLQCNDRGVYRIILRCAATAGLAGLSLCVLVLLFARASLSSDLAGLVPYSGSIAAWVFFAILQRQLAESFRGLGDVRAATILGGIRNNGILNAVLCSAAMAGLLFAGALTLATAFVAMALSSGTVCVVAVVMLLVDRESRAPSSAFVSGFGLKSALAEGWPVWLGALISATNFMGSTWLVEFFDDSADVAQFGVAQRLVLVLMAPMLVINSVLPPAVAQLHAAREPQKLERLVRTTSGVGFVASFAALLAIVVVGKPLLAFAFGAFYQGAYPILVLLCVAQVIGISLGAWQVVLPMTGGSRQMLIASAVALVSQLVLGTALGQYGVIGVSVAVCLSMLLSSFTGMYFVRRKVGISTIAAFDPSVFVGLLRRFGLRAKVGNAS
jgi:O-antigen/teichoic acid export membrane protein